MIRPSRRILEESPLADPGAMSVGTAPQLEE